MIPQTIRLQTRNITDWTSFHSVCAKTLKFPDYYGRNMNAWIDCVEDAALAAARQPLCMEIADSADFRKRLPDISQALIECAEFVNRRRVEQKKHPILALVLK